MPNELKGIDRYDSTKKAESDDRTVTKMVITSVLSILLCIVCLCSMSWAWFKSSKNVGNTKISAASYDVSVVVTHDSIELAQPADGVYTFEKDVNYTVTLTATGNASTGFANMKFRKSGTDGDAEIKTTDKIAHGASLTFTVTFDEDTNVKFSSQWGTPTVSDINADAVFTYNYE